MQARNGLCQFVTVLLLSLLTLKLGETQESGDPGAKHLFQEALRLEEQGDIEKALEAYLFVANRFPKSSFAPQAILRRGWGLFYRFDYKGATEAADDLIKNYQESRYAAGGVVLMAEVEAREAQDRTGLEGARTKFRRVAFLFPPEAYPVLSARAEARVRSGELSRLLSELPLAAAAFVSAIEDEPPSEWTIRAEIGLANTLLAEGDWLAAAEILQGILLPRALQGRPDPRILDEARVRLSMIDRLILRPKSGDPSWVSARLLPVTGAELKRPIAVAAHDDGRLALVDRGSEKLLWLTSDGVVAGSAPVKEAGRPWWRREKQALGEETYVADGDRVLWIPGPSSQTFEIPRGDKREPVKRLEAGERGLFGQFFLLQGSTHQVIAFSSQGDYLGTVFDGDALDVARDSLGRLYVLSKAGQVYRFSSEGTPEGIAIHGSWDNPVAIDVDFLGRVYVLERSRRRIQVFDSAGASVATVGPDLPGQIVFRNPQDLAIDGSGRLFVADMGLRGVLVLE